MSIAPDHAPAGGLDLAEREDTSTVEPGDHERLAHYVRKTQIPDAYVFGTPVTALCGKKWVPNRDPEKFQVCPECQEIMDTVVGTGPLAGKGGDT